MIKDVGEWFRVFGVTANDDRLTQRRHSAARIANSIASSSSKIGIVRYVSYAISIIRSTEPDLEGICDEVAEEIKEDQPSFDPHADSARMDMRLTALIAVSEVLSQIQIDGVSSSKLRSAKQIVAQAVCSALRFRADSVGGFLEGKISDLLARSENILSDLDSERRTRKTLAVTLDRTVAGQEVSLASLQTSFSKSLRSLQAAQKLDAEELQALWWTFSAFSYTMRKHYSLATPAEAALLAGYELSEILSGPGSLGLAQLAARTASSSPSAEKISLENIAKEPVFTLPEVVRSSFASDYDLPTIFPVICLLRNGDQWKIESCLVSGALTQSELAIQMFSELRLFAETGPSV